MAEEKDNKDHDLFFPQGIQTVQPQKPKQISNGKGQLVTPERAVEILEQLIKEKLLT